MIYSPETTASFVDLSPEAKAYKDVPFVEYQQKEAWTWEHQALLHARAVAGDPGLRAEFERVRVALLVGAVKRDTLREEVRGMRERMRRELSRAKPGSGIAVCDHVGLCAGLGPCTRARQSRAPAAAPTLQRTTASALAQSFVSPSGINFPLAAS